MPDFLKYLPIIMQIINLIPKLQAALQAKTSVIDIIKQLAPEVLPIFQQLGTGLFPSLDPTQAANAGALILSTDVVRTIQTQLNILKVTDDSGAALVPDGSYGAKTKQAATKFQKANGLTADGWAGAMTQAALSSAVAKLPAA